MVPDLPEEGETGAAGGGGCESPQPQAIWASAQDPQAGPQQHAPAVVEQPVEASSAGSLLTETTAPPVTANSDWKTKARMTSRRIVIVGSPNMAAFRPPLNADSAANISSERGTGPHGTSIADAIGLRGGGQGAGGLKLRQGRRQGFRIGYRLLAGEVLTHIDRRFDADRRPVA